MVLVIIDLGYLLELLLFVMERREDRRAVCVLLVVCYELARPRGLAKLVARQELAHHRFDVDHWRVVDCIELGDVQLRVVDLDDVDD